MAKLNITRKKFEEMYYSKTNEELCEIFNICPNTLWRWKNELGLKNKPRGRKSLSIEFAEE